MSDSVKPTVDIDLPSLHDLSCAIGVMVRVFEEWDKEIFASPHDKAVPSLLVCTFLLDRSIGGELFKVAWGCFLDVAARRAILPGTPKEVRWPSWDEDSLEHPELSPIYDLAIILSAWNYAAKQDELPPEMFLGPLFSLSGVIVEGVENGYHLKDDKFRTAYEQQRVALASSHGSEEEFKIALQKQLGAIDDALQNLRKTTLN